MHLRKEIHYETIQSIHPSIVDEGKQAKKKGKDFRRRKKRSFLIIFVRPFRMVFRLFNVVHAMIIVNRKPLP